MNIHMHKARILVTISILFMVYWLAFFDRNLVSPLLPLMIKEWNISFLNAGLIGSLALFTYGLGQIPVGYLADKYNRKTIILTGCLSIGIINLVQGLLKTFPSFILFRGVFGIATAGCLAPTMALTRDLVPMEHRAKAFGLLGLGTTLGPLLALLWGKQVVAQYHWSLVFATAAIPAFLIAGLLTMFIKEERPEQQFSAAATGPPAFGWHTYKLALLNKRLWVVYLVWFCIVWVFYTLLHFLPTFLSSYHHYSVEKAAYIATGWLWTGLVVSLPGGWISDKIRSRKYFNCISSGLANLGILFIPFVPTNIVFPLLLFIGCCWFSTTGAFYAWCSEIFANVSPAIIASGLALASFFGQMGGATGVAFSGKLADLFGVKYLISSAGIAGLLGVLLMFLWLPESFIETENN